MINGTSSIVKQDVVRSAAQNLLNIRTMEFCSNIDVMNNNLADN